MHGCSKLVSCEGVFVVKSRNERDIPRPMLPAGNAGRLIPDCRGRLRRKVGIVVKTARAPYVHGCKHATMASTKSCRAARWSESRKARLSSNWCSIRPHEVGVASNGGSSNAAVNTFPGLVHTRPSPRGRSATPEARSPNPVREGAVGKVGSAIGSRVVTQVAVPEGAARSPPF